MVKSIIIGIIGITGLMIFWLFIQNIWRDQFSDMISDEDVLAARGGCGNCGCENICVNKQEKINE